MKTIVDTGFVVAVEDRNDQNRPKCFPLYNQAQFIFMPQSVLNEVCYLLTRSGGNRATASDCRK